MLKRISNIFFLLLFLLNQYCASNPSSVESKVFYAKNNDIESFKSGNINQNFNEVLKNNDEEKAEVLVVLVHGFTSDKNLDRAVKCMTDFTNLLKNEQKNKNIKYFVVNCVGTRKTPIFKQAILVKNQIKQHIEEKHYDQKIPILLIGYSAGCLTCFTIYKNHSDLLKVNGIISINGTWYGMSILDKSCKKKKYKLFLSFFTKGINNNQLGIKDILPNSSFLSWVHENLKNCDVPIYTIGCKSDAISNLFAIEPFSTIFNLNKTSEKEIYGSLEHDGYIALKSQSGFELPNLTFIELNKRMIHGLSLKTHFNKFFEKIAAIDFILTSSTKSKIDSIKKENVAIQDELTVKTVSACIMKILK